MKTGFNGAVGKLNYRKQFMGANLSETFDDDTFLEAIAKDPELLEKYKQHERQRRDESIVFNDLVDSIVQWGFDNEEQIKALEVDEGIDLTLMFGFLISEFVNRAEVEERGLLDNLLDQIDILEV